MRSPEVECPECKHVFAPTYAEIRQVVERADDFMVSAFMVAGVDDLGVLDQFTLPKRVWRENEQRHVDLTYTPEDIQRAVRNRLDTRLKDRLEAADAAHPDQNVFSGVVGQRV